MKPITRRLALVAAVALGIASGAAAAEFPERSIKLIVPYGPGGGTDTIARLYAGKMAEVLKQTIAVENRPGASTIIGTQALLSSPADGYTVLMGDATTFVVNPAAYQKLPYKSPDDFASVGQMTRGGLVLVVNPSLGVNSVQELIELARKRPGGLSYGTPGNATPHHLAMELLKQRSDANLIQVPYRGEAPALQDVLAGTLSAMFVGPVVGEQHIKEGKLRALGISSPTPVAMLPAVQPIAQSIPGYALTYWHALVAPRGTPPAVIQKLNAALVSAAADPGVQKRMAEMGVDVVTGSPQDLDALMRKDGAGASEIVKRAGITIE